MPDGIIDKIIEDFLKQGIGIDLERGHFNADLYW